jgi:DNA-binding CsgD family transcriptional regulator
MGWGQEPASARVAQARSRAGERGDAQRQALRPLGLIFIAVVVTVSVQAHPAPGLEGAGLGVAVVLAVYAAAVLTAISVGWARRGPATQAAVSGLIGGCGVALAVLQPNGPVEIAASMGVWIAAVRLAPVPAAATAGAITAALALAVGLSNAEIAGRLYLSHARVKTHINRIFAKTGARDRAQAVRYAYHHGYQ